MKKILLLLAMLLVTTIAMSQIKVATSGNVGIGSNKPLLSNSKTKLGHCKAKWEYCKAI